MPSVEGLKTADLVDAMGRLHRHRCHLLDLISPTPGRVLSGEATRWGGDQVTPFQANVPVVLAGVGVMPGQYVFADSSGAA